MLERLLIDALNAQAKQDNDPFNAPYVDTSDPCNAVLDGRFDLKKIAEALDPAPKIIDVPHQIMIQYFGSSRIRCGECDEPIGWRHLDGTPMCEQATLILMGCYKDDCCSSCQHPVQLVHVN